VDAARGGPYVTAVSVTAEPETNDQTPAASPSPWNQADRGLREAGDDRRRGAALCLNGASLGDTRLFKSQVGTCELLGEEGARVGDQTFGHFARRFTIGTRSLFLHSPFGLGRRPRHCRRIGSGRWPARLISLSQLRDDELRFWQSEFRLHVGERCQELLLDLQGMWLVGEADLRCVDFKLLVLGLPGESCLKPFSAWWKNIRLFVCEAAEKSRPYLASLAASLAVTEIDLTMACNLSTLRA
jgi:hypothetical protein